MQIEELRNKIKELIKGVCIDPYIHQSSCECAVNEAMDCISDYVGGLIGTDEDEAWKQDTGPYGLNSDLILNSTSNPRMQRNQLRAELRTKAGLSSIEK